MYQRHSGNENMMLVKGREMVRVIEYGSYVYLLGIKFNRSGKNLETICCMQTIISA